MPLTIKPTIKQTKSILRYVSFLSDADLVTVVSDGRVVSVFILLVIDCEFVLSAACFTDCVVVSCSGLVVLFKTTSDFRERFGVAVIVVDGAKI